MKKRISNVFVKGTFGYLLMAPLNTYNYVPTSITGLFSFTRSLAVVTSKSSCTLTKAQKQKKNLHIP
jgi:hypothetical protein